MLKTVMLVALVSLLIVGCVEGFLTQRTAEENTQIQIESEAELRAILGEAMEDAQAQGKDALVAILADFKSKVEDTQAYQAGRRVGIGVWDILAALGIVGGGAYGLKKRNDARVAVKKTWVARDKTWALAQGLQAIEEAINTAGKDGKVITGNIREQGTEAIAAVDAARRLAHEL